MMWQLKKSIIFRKILPTRPYTKMVQSILPDFGVPARPSLVVGFQLKSAFPFHTITYFLQYTICEPT